MSRTKFSSFPLAALLAVCATSVSAEITEAATTPTASEFNSMHRYAISYDDPRELAELYLDYYGFKPRDAEMEQHEHPSDSSRRILLVTVDGIKDDSIRGLQLRLVVRASAGGWETDAAGMRRMCYRGPEAGQWTMDLCP